MKSLIIVCILLILIIITAGIYNSLITKKNRVKNSWSQIDVQLKRRFDLIPNLVSTVKGYVKHEADTLEAITKARTQYVNAATPADMIKANSEMTGALSRLFAVAESYPELKANSNFDRLQRELSSVEERISFARQFYNDTVLIYNNARQIFPNIIVARLFDFGEEPYFRAEENERRNIEVKFQS